MKKIRHKKIIEIVEAYDIETQEDLISRLRAAGFDVTQATVSRDIRELKLTKGMSESGKYRYMPPSADEGERQSVYTSALMGSVKSVDYAMNNLVVKTYPGMAQAVAAALDSFHEKAILGCVAGDDAIIVVVRDEASAAALAAKIRGTGYDS